MQIAFFRRFLIDAGLIEGKGKNTQVVVFTNLLTAIGWDSEISYGLMLVNLVAANPQINWYVKNLAVGMEYRREDVEQTLQGLEVSVKDSSSIVKAFKRIVELPFGTKLRFGEYLKDRGGDVLRRTKTATPDARVVLYALYKFAEACEGYYEFTLSRLMDFTVESAGVSPAEIFGLSREEMEQHLNSLSHSHPDFISYTSTHDLEVVRLADNKKSADVLELF